MTASEPTNRPRFGAVALLLGASVALSRVVGYVREIILANQLGAGPRTDAYYAAFTIPDVLNYLLAGGALTIAFIPFYTRVRRDEGDHAAQRLFEVVLGTTGALAVLATAALYAVSGELVPRIFHKFDPETQQLTLELTRILLPAQIFFVTGGILRAVLMVEGRFLSHAAAPVVYNAGIIAGGLASGTPEGFAWGALGGAIAGPFLLPVVDLARTHRIAIRVAPFAPDLRAYLWIALPLMLGLSLTTVDEWYEKYFGQSVAVGVVAYLGFARRLVQAPIAVIGQAIGVAALPALTRYHNEGKGEQVDRLLGGALAAAIALGLLAAAFVFAFAPSIVELVYHHGAFDDGATERTAAVLAVMSFAIPGWVVQQVAVRAFYAREEMWRPMLLGTGLVIAVLPLYIALGESDGAEGLALAGALAMSVNALLTLGWARARFGGPALAPLVDAGVRGAVIASAAGWVGSLAAALPFVERLAPVDGKWLAVARLGVGGAAFAASAAVGIALVGDPATRGSAARVLRRLGIGR